MPVLHRPSELAAGNWTSALLSRKSIALVTDLSGIEHVWVNSSRLFQLNQ